MVFLIPDRIHFWFNAFEAGLWFIVGVALIVLSRRTVGQPRRIGTVAGLAFLAFAGTDLIELRTGAWYRPWWMAVYNATCVTAIVVCYGLYRLHRRNAIQRAITLHLRGG